MVKFLFLIFLFCFFNIMIDYFLVTDEIVYDSLIDKLSYERITEILIQSKNAKWISYAFLPCFLFFKILFVVICFYIGTFFLKSKVSFRQLFSSATSSEFVFIIPVALKFIWFSLFQNQYSFDDFQKFSSSFSIAALEPINNLPLWLKYPFKKINFFEAFYWVIMSCQLMRVLGNSFLESLGFVASTYGVGLGIWILLVMFIMLSIS
jgi:hypothetical protein